MPDAHQTHALDEIGVKRKRWIEAVNTGDAARFVSVLAADAVWLPAGPAAMSGREAVTEWLNGAFDQLDYDFSLETTTVRVLDGWAIETGRFTTLVRSRSDPDPLPEHAAAYTILWRYHSKEGWLIDRYADLGPPGPSPPAG